MRYPSQTPSYNVRRSFTLNNTVLESGEPLENEEGRLHWVMPRLFENALESLKYEMLWLWAISPTIPYHKSFQCDA